MPPLGLMRLASVTPPEYEVEIIDENVEKIKYDNTDLVGISAMTSLANRAYEIADRYRSRGVKVILGGIHPSILPEEAITHADAVVIGEADLIWKEVLRDFGNNELKKFYQTDSPPDLSSLPVIKANSMIKNKYFFPNSVQTSRGCPFGCDFCSVSQYNGVKIRHRPIEHILSEIDNFKTGLMKKMFFFTDDNIAGNPVYSEELFKAIKPLKLKWGSQASITIAKNEKILKLAAESGCTALLIGFESLKQESLDEVHKAYKAREYKEMVKRIHDHGIVLEGAFIFGFDNDDKDVFEKTLDFCHETGIDVAQFTALTPFPGTRLFERMKEANRLITYNWDYYDAFNVVFRPKNMTVEELQDGIRWAYYSFYSTKSIAKRFFSLLFLSRSYLPFLIFYLLTNFDFKKLMNWKLNLPNVQADVTDSEEINYSS
jgi:radical SAM superfamily enzyme YgiQ (UPF0313 family)